ncbi:acyltransferase [Halobacteriales archaeon QH_7_68_42]|nr:MAG: acyltransferase [Halobacteriales archaeon QH_7_68_42]
MSLRSAELDELAIPDGTTVEEHDLVTDGDVVVGGQSTVEFGVRGDDVMAGDVLVGGSAYVGERVSIDGGLKVAGNADIGDDVEIADTFEASGHIEIRNPMPTVVFLVIYLSQLLRIGEEEAAEELADQLVADEGETQPVVIPRGARVSDDAWRVSTPATVGDDCRIHGNIRAESLTAGADTVVFGSLRAKGDVAVGDETEIKGDVTTRGGDVRIGRDAHVWGDVSAEDVELHEHAVVEGTIRVSGELTQVRDALGPEPAADADEDVADSDAEAAEESAVDDEDADVEDVIDVADAEGGDGGEDQDADGNDEAPDDGEFDPEEVQSREEVEESLDGVVPMVGERPDPEPNGHDEDAEVTPDAD